MLRVQIICVGKLHERFWMQANDEYCKRLSAFCNLEIIELPEHRLPENPSDTQILQALEKETQAIRKKIQPNATLCAMCIEGKMHSSVDFAAKLNDIMCSGTSKLTILIGGSFGLSEEIKREATLRLSMSPMTFPHHFARIMLLEQLYRAFSIQNGGKYHK